MSVIGECVIGDEYYRGHLPAYARGASIQALKFQAIGDAGYDGNQRHFFGYYLPGRGIDGAVDERGIVAGVDIVNGKDPFRFKRLVAYVPAFFITDAEVKPVIRA